MAFNMTAMRAAVGGCAARPAAPAAPVAVLPCFSGLGVANRLCLHAPAGAASNILSFPQNGAKVFAMRHRMRVAKLNRPADQRKALVRGLVTQVLRHGRITTTKTRAKAIRKYVDKMIQLAKALAFIYDKDIVKSLFDEAPGRYGDRDGGYCRVITEARARRGDAAEMAAIELV